MSWITLLHNSFHILIAAGHSAGFTELHVFHLLPRNLVTKSVTNRNQSSYRWSNARVNGLF